jgi:hypothetical protein
MEFPPFPPCNLRDLRATILIYHEGTKLHEGSRRFQSPMPYPVLSNRKEKTPDIAIRGISVFSCYSLFDYQTLRPAPRTL